MWHRAYALLLFLAPLGLCFVSPRSEGPASKSIPVPRRPDPALVDELDAAIQKRFSLLTEDDMSSGRFGMARQIDLRALHSLLLQADEQVVHQPAEHLSEAGWRTAFYVAGEWDVRKKKVGMITGPIVMGADPWDPSLDRRALEPLGERVLADGQKVRSVEAGLPVEARPIPASSRRCLSCHRGKRVGDPIGVVLYAFTRSEGRPSAN
jgi:hypothetical protein